MVRSISPASLFAARDTGRGYFTGGAIPSWRREGDESVRRATRQARSPVSGVLVLLGFLVALVSGVRASSARCVPADETAARTLVLALDGVPYRVALEVRERGAFSGWPAPVPLVSTFPSMTNVAFAAMLVPLGSERVAGYELRHFDREANRLRGGGAFNYKKRAFGWRDYFQVIGRSASSKVGLYMTPKSKARSVMAKVEKLVLDAPEELMLAHLAATDMLHHFRGDEAVISLLLEIDERLQDLEAEHRDRFGRPLRVVILSDHGNGLPKVRNTTGLRSTLRRAGFRLGKRLKDADTVVAPTYGAVNYGVVHLRPERAEEAAKALITHEAVALVAWRRGEAVVGVLGKDGEGEIRWRDAGGERLFAYEARRGDPLRLRAALRETGVRTDRRGFAPQQAWFRASALGSYPDALRRLVDALAGTYVENAASVAFSIAPGWAWGLKVVRVGAFLLGGKQEGTHGGLDRDSSLGLFWSNDPESQPRAALSAGAALRPFAAQSDCMRVSSLDPEWEGLAD